jgi:PAS domain S-box-containing protein
VEDKLDSVLKILVIEDNQADFQQIEHWLKVDGLQTACCRVDSLDEVRAAINSNLWDVVIADYVVPGLDFLDAFHVVQACLPATPVILVSGAVGEAKAVELLKSGISDFLLKSDLHRLSHVIVAALREATERRAKRAAEAALRLSEDRYRALFQVADEALGVFMLGPDGQPGRFTDVNRSSCDLLGYEREELLQLSPTDLAIPSERDRLPTMFENLKRNKHVYLEVTLVAKSGQLIPVEIGAAFLELESQPTVLAIVRDLTGKKRAEEMLRQRTAATVVHHRKRSRRDVAVIASLGVLTLLVPSRFRVFEPLSLWVLEYNAFLVDEIVITAVFLVLALIVYALRRQQDYREEVVARNEADVALRELQDELESRVHSRTADLNRANEDLGRSTQRLSLATESAQLGIWDLDLKQNVLTWDRRMYELYGIRPVDFAGAYEAWKQGVHPDDLATADAAVKDAVARSKRLHTEFRVVWPDGQVRHIEAHAVVQDSLAGLPQRMIGVNWDITERKQAEEALRLKGAALHAAADAILIADHKGAIEWVNPAFVDLTGYLADEIIGKNPRELIKSGVHDRAFYKHLWDTILAGDVWRGEITNCRKDGSHYVEDMVVTPVMDARGVITHFIAIKRDLTKDKVAESKFLQAQKMEVVGRLAGGIAHDFNNLLTVINGTAELALTDVREGDPLRKDLEAIRQAGVRAASLTRQLLAFSRQQVAQVEVLNLNSLIASLRSMLPRLIGEDIRLVVAPATDDAYVKADAGQLEQALMNLVVNARDAMPKGGGLTITTENVELDEAQAAACQCSPRPGPHVRLAVSDTGTGMDEKTRRRIFEPFFTTKEQGKGTGLGLATVFGIVTQAGGGISVDTELGRGSTFTVYLPRVADVTVASEPGVTARAAAATGSILVVEDEDGVRHLAQRMLESIGYTVLAARDAAEALLILEHHENHVDLMLTDVVMPRMSGPELAERAATIRPDMQVLFSSGHTDNAALRASVLDNDAHFVGKPYTRSALLREVREALEAQPGAERTTGLTATALGERRRA